MTISLSIKDLLMLSFLLQGFILAGLLFYTSKKIRNNRWIAALILMISLIALMPELDRMGIIWQQPWLLYILFPSTFAVGPLIYFYTRSLVAPENPRPTKKYIHFLPVLLDMKHQFIFLLFVTGALSVPTIQNFYFRATVQDFLFEGDTLAKATLALISTSIYSILSYRMILGYEVQQDSSLVKATDIKWLKTMLHLMFALITLWLVSIIIDREMTAAGFTWNYYMLYVPVLLFVYWLGMSAYLRQSKMSKDEVAVYNRPPVKIHFSDEEAATYRAQLLHMVETDHLYLNPLLKLDDLAAKLNIPEKYLSNLLNQNIGKNFNDFINAYRVEESKRKLADPAFNKFTIAAVAYECGFNSLATFQRCFKQFTGTTPSKYQGSINPSLQINTTQITI